jgi:hypothetical protein
MTSRLARDAVAALLAGLFGAVAGLPSAQATEPVPRGDSRLDGFPFSMRMPDEDAGYFASG